MKKLIILAIVMILSVAMAVPAIAAPPLHKVTGGGTVDFEGLKETYGFTAIQVDESGNAKGNMQFTWHYSPWWNPELRQEIYHADILYLAVNDDTGDAWIGGVITKSNEWGFVGAEFYIRVRDAGEGRKASGSDMIGYTYFGPPGQASKALNMYDKPLFEFTNGNVKLK